jgi:hypothetical protein
MNISKSLNLIAQGSSSPSGGPVIHSFSLIVDSSDFNTVVVKWSVDASSVILQKRVNGVVEDLNIKESYYSFRRDSLYEASFTIVAFRDGYSIFSSPIIVSKYLGKPENDGVKIIQDFSVSSAGNSSVNVSIALGSELLVQSVILHYRNERSTSWITETLLKPAISTSDKVSALKYQSISIDRDALAANFYFYVTIQADKYPTNYSDTTTIFFPNLSVGVANTTGLFQLDDRPANLRYEIVAKFSEKYDSIYNSSETKSSFNHQFLDEEVFKGLSSNTSFAFRDENSESVFRYEYNTRKNNGNTKGFFYPACVSEILPCIKVVEDKVGGRNQVTLFWKICDSFFNYSFLNKKINVNTESLSVDITYNGISIKEDTLTIANYDLKNELFVYTLTNNSISESDNFTNALKITVKKHKGTFTSPYRSSAFEFSKLMMPPKWHYLVYDKYVSSANRGLSDSLSFSFNDPNLKGIKLPQEGFQKFDRLIGQVDNEAGTLDVSTLYKLDSYVNAYYTDPILQGTVNYLEMPSIPEDVFLVAPNVVIPAPNLDKTYGMQAKAIVDLNEYGKIRGIQITDPGSGYSLFKTEADKRIQTFSDLTPVVETTYTIISSKSTISKAVLIPVNSSFSRLMASLRGGVRLANFQQDKIITQGTLTDEQAAIVADYEQRNNLQASQEAPSQSISPGPNASPEGVGSNAKSNSIPVFDQSWEKITKLFAKRKINPIEQVNIYNKSVDLGASSLEDSSVLSSIGPSSTPLEATNTNFYSSSGSSGDSGFSLFVLNNILVIPDSSAAVSIARLGSLPPWLTLLPLFVRSDGAYAFGALPNMKPRAEMFNSLARAVNNLNEVRLFAPMIWAVDKSRTITSFIDKNSYGSLNSLEKYTYKQVYDNVEVIDDSSSYYVPINSSFSAEASRKVGRLTKEGNEKQYNIFSTEDVSSTSFFAQLHPLMADALPKLYSRGIKGSFLGLVSEDALSCSSVVLDNYDCNGNVAIKGGFPIPFSADHRSTYFKVYNYGGAVSTVPRGTPYLVKIGACLSNCEERSVVSADFRFVNMLPTTIKL